MATAQILGVTTDLSTLTTDEYGNVCFTFDGVAGSTYSITVSNFTTNSGGLEVNNQDGRAGFFEIVPDNPEHTLPAFPAITISGSGQFTAEKSGQHEVYLDSNTTLIAFDFVSAAPTIDELINDALSYVKTYVDTKDASVKTYVDSKVDALMQTTDLTAKLQLLNEINQILDGDTSTAGFQLWESNVAKLNQVIADLTAESAARESSINATSSSFQNLINSKVGEIYSEIDSISSGLNGSITTVDSKVTANFFAMKSKAAVIFAV